MGRKVTVDVLNERYRLIELVGEGGMGQLWRAHDETLDRHVAVKLISNLSEAPEAAARLRREARSAARLISPHLAIVLDYGRDARTSRDYVVSEFVPGLNLHQIIRKSGPQEPKQVARWAVQICTALDVVHGAGVYHRDLKPHNVMLTADGLIKLVDFGIAAYAEASDYTRITMSGSIVGSPAYMSPEQVLNAPIDHRSDFYSLGCTLYELLTGRAPFAGTLPAVLLAHAHTPAPAPSLIRAGISQQWDDIILTLLAKDPLQRPQSSVALRQKLEALFENYPTIPLRPQSPRPTSAGIALPAKINRLDKLELPGDEVTTGRVKWWNDTKRFGFLTPDKPGPDVFVHYSMLAPGCYGLFEGQRVSFRVVQLQKGPGAEDVTPI
ncbi:hypothetical protein GCM10011608_43580 [Micromonospora sonchi]|uniref:non-specific serine/threonine protein kinase n=1 Tax=Micromonospora sonchi TaxID=1763543 RepID=A0A917U311_9ACTN|nr:protein kinase [Micromonospora sonchi]GGM53917.1 hypothetical protein GCM10011608_43580 [Micromonospora sonchi]